MNLIDPITHEWTGTRDLSGDSINRNKNTLKLSKIIKGNAVNPNSPYETYSRGILSQNLANLSGKYST
jgi:hypothetical protein